MNKIIRTKEERQQEHARRIKKGEITRTFSSIVSASNVQIQRANAADSHKVGRELKQLVNNLPDHERNMLNKLLGMIACHDGREITREYFTKMLNRCLKTISRYYTQFEMMGLIRVIQTVKAPNQFYLGAAALNEIVRNYVMGALPSLRLILGLSLLASPQVHAANVPQYNKKNLINIGIGKKNNKKGTVEQRLFDAFPMFSYIAKKFPNSNPNVLKKDYQMLKSLEITQAGIANLLPYPSSAITWADEQLAIALAKGSMKDPFAFLVKKANDWCKERGMRPDWRPMYEAYEAQSITNDMPRFEKILVSSPKKSYTKSNPNTPEPNPVPRIDKPGACCYWKELDVNGRYDYLKKQLGLKPERCSLDEEGNPWPISEHYRVKVTCSHGRD